VPRVRSIHQLISGPVLAIDQRGMDRLHAQCLAQLSDSPLRQMIASSDEASAEDSNSWREFIKSTGLFPYFINPSGQVVHTLDEGWKDAIQQGAVAVMPVQGALVREAWTYEELFWGLVSAERLTNFMRGVQHDDRVAGLVATVNCPGGMVSGTEKLGRTFAKLGAVKPTVLHVDDLAASAAYWFGCHARRVMLDGQTAEVGSVGVMLSFLDFIPWIEKLGAVYHELYAPESDKKNEDWRQLREKRDPKLIQESLGVTARLFRSVVTTARPALASQEAVLQGIVLGGQEAIDAGLADGFGDIDACIELVRAGTETATAPPQSDPTSSVPPTVDDDTSSEAQTQAPMKFAKQFAAFIAGLFTADASITQEDIDAANQELDAKELNVQLVSSSEIQRLKEQDAKVAAAEEKAAKAETAATEAEAAKNEAVIARSNSDTAATEAKAKADSATEQLTSLQAAATTACAENEVEVAEGASAVEALAAALKATRAELATANSAIAELKNEDTPTAGPKTPVGANGGDPVTTDEKSQTWKQL